jgi:hypothetical protein
VFKIVGVESEWRAAFDPIPAERVAADPTGDLDPLVRGCPAKG